MKTITTTYYEYKELTDEAKEKAIETLHHGYEYPWWDEAKQSLDAFADQFGTRVYRYSIDLDSNAHTQLSFIDICEYTTKETREILKQLEDNAKNGVLLCGYWLFETLLAGARMYFDDNKNDLSVIGMMNQASALWLQDMRSDYEHSTSDEEIVESIEANDYLFDAKGNLAPLEVYTAIPVFEDKSLTKEDAKILDTFDTNDLPVINPNN